MDWYLLYIHQKGMLKVLDNLSCACLSSSSIIDWNNPVIINKMYKVYLGDVPLKTKVCKHDLSSDSNLTFEDLVYNTVLCVH